jgi:hypothetical protein
MSLEKNVAYKESKMDFTEIITRNDFHKIIDHYDLKVGVEIGVGVGSNAMHLLDNSGIEILYGVDNWSVRSSSKAQKSTKDNLAEYGERFKMLEMRSLEAVELFEDESIDFVYIDGNHRYKPVVEDIKAWYPKVRKGGFFGGHDYVVARGCGVIKAVDDYFEAIDREFYLTREPIDTNVNISFWMIK